MSAPTHDEAFWKAHPGVVWSNANATDTQRIRAALVRPRFLTLLDIAVHFGLERVQQEWAVLLAHEDAEIRRARPLVERILGNIETGRSLAAAGD